MTKLEELKEDCRLINLRYEYVGYTGSEEWLISTDLEEHELVERYGDLLDEYKPYILITKEQGEAITAYESNEKKHRDRNANFCDVYDYEDDTFEAYHPEMICDLFNENYHKYDDLKEAFSHLNMNQKKRIYKYFVLGYSYIEIAKEENISHTAVRASITRGLTTMRSYIEKQKYE